MNSNEKRRIVLFIAVLVIAIALIVVLVNGRAKNKEQMPENNVDTNQEVQNVEQYVTQLDDGTKLNNSELFNSVKTYKDLEISNIQFTEKNGLSVLLADVKNNATTTHEEEVVKIVLLGENDETIATLRVLIGKIEPGETSQINTTASADYANAKYFKVEASE